MNLVECINTRRSIRKFTEEPVSHEVIEKIVDLAKMAPSWKNTQITRYTVIETKELKDRIATEATNAFNANTLNTAAAIVAVSVVKNRCGFERDGSYTTTKKDSWQMFDAGVASQTFCLAAHEYGIGSVIMGIFDYDKVAEIIDLPDTQEMVALIAIGHPAEEPQAPKRKTVEELVSYK